MKKILVTGASSFLGHHVMPLLNHYVSTINARPYIKINSNRDNFEILSPTSKELNLLDRDMVINYICDNKPDIILHMAALCGGIGANKNSPAEFAHDNLKMSVNLFDGIRKVNQWGREYSSEINPPVVTHFYGLGTICAFPKNCPIPFKENDIWNGYPEETNAPYGNAKRMMMVLQQSFRQQFGLKGAHLIPVNLYGIEDHFNLENSHVMPALINKFITAKENGDQFVEVWGDGTPTREFLYAGDCAIAIVRAILTGFDYPEPINIGTGQDISIKDLADLIKEVVDFKGTIKFTGDISVNGQPKRRLDVSRAKNVLGFTAKTDLRTGLQKTIAWYRKSLSDNSKMQDLVKEIRDSIGDLNLLNDIAKRVDSIKPNINSLTEENKDFLLNLILRAKLAPNHIVNEHGKVISSHPSMVMQKEDMQKKDLSTVDKKCTKTSYNTVGKFHSILTGDCFDKDIIEKSFPIKDKIVHPSLNAEKPVIFIKADTNKTPDNILSEDINAFYDKCKEKRVQATKAVNGDGNSAFKRCKTDFLEDYNAYCSKYKNKQLKATEAIKGNGNSSFRRDDVLAIKDNKYNKIASQKKKSLNDYEREFAEAIEHFKKHYCVNLNNLKSYKNGKSCSDIDIRSYFDITDTEIMTAKILDDQKIGHKKITDKKYIISFVKKVENYVSKKYLKKARKILSIIIDKDQS